MDYFEFVDVMRKSTLILTDSGGIQEEAPALGKPVLVLYETTERPEAVATGVARVAGTDKAKIVEQATLLLTDRSVYERMASGTSPYGDGAAAERIVAVLANGSRNDVKTNPGYAGPS